MQLVRAHAAIALGLLIAPAMADPSPGHHTAIGVLEGDAQALLLACRGLPPEAAASAALPVCPAAVCLQNVLLPVSFVGQLDIDATGAVSLDGMLSAPCAPTFQISCQAEPVAPERAEGSCGFPTSRFVVHQEAPGGSAVAQVRCLSSQCVTVELWDVGWLTDQVAFWSRASGVLQLQAV